ncbi:MAG: AAA family ATPase [Burkholderiales bacterium]|nr:AAA family ATPase [Burkholderiales bacterium]
MYLNHFGLSEAPYRITPHTDFFFAGANRGATLEALLYAITNDEGIVKVTGEVGSGKTMLCRVLMERLPAHVETIYLANPSLGRDEIMLAILDDLQVNSAGERSSVILRALQDRLIALYGEGRRVVVLIDEAHAMPVETLEEIRLLSNLESSRHKLLQIVLFGQQELDEVLGTQQMRQLKERIVHSFRLEPLVRSDVGSYLMFRMRQAGYRGPDIFSDGAVRRIAEASEGLTRRINILADKALLAAFAESAHQILPKHVNAAIADSEFSRLHKSRPRPGLSTITLMVAAVALIATGAAAALLAVNIALRRAPPTVGATAPPTLPVAPQAPPTAGSASGAGGSALVAGGSASVVGGSATLAGGSPPVAGGSPPVAGGSPPTATASTPGASAVVAAETKPAVPPDAATITGRPSTPTPSAPTPADGGPTTTAAAKGSAAETLLARRERATEAWLRDAPGQTFTLQLLTADAARAAQIDLWLARLPPGTDPDRIYVYNSIIRGQPRYSVLYGNYPDRASASAAMADLPAKLREGKPIIRTLAGIRTDLKSQ